jgi:maleylacetate reductase
MRDFVHDAPGGRVVFGRGALKSVPDEVAELGAKRVMLIAGTDSPYGDQLADLLGELVAERVTRVIPHVPVQSADDTAELARAVNADLLVCVGGGSAIGLAKAVALETALPILAVPTTYAGSEMTPIWGRTDGIGKTTGRDRIVLPRIVVYDPELTLSLPADISAASGMNALAHMVEGLYAPDASPITLLHAEEGIRVIARALPNVVADPADIGWRSEALYGAWLAGSVLGTATMGLHHKICHVLGGAYDLPHAGTHSAVLPYVTAYNSGSAPEAMLRLGRALGTTEPAQALWDLAQSVGAPTSLHAVGFSEYRVDDAAQRVARAKPLNPRHIDQDSVRQLLLEALAGRSPRKELVSAVEQ